MRVLPLPCVVTLRELFSCSSCIETLVYEHVFFDLYLGFFTQLREEISKRSSKRIVHYLVRETWQKKKFPCENFLLVKNPKVNLCFDPFLASCDQTTWHSK